VLFRQSRIVSCHCRYRSVVARPGQIITITKNLAGHIAAARPAADNSAVGAGTVVPEGDSFRRAVAWLLEQPDRTLATIEAASQRFDLTPLESAVLFRYFSPSSDRFKDQ
jgi:hypothetical protein